ncbi:PEP-CTERM sorting domain-containing protein [Nitrosomonas aestuarii]|uniref:PEP-CTERM sorting domain-containing protein n=1 Tax=Nitrosomonas aestuarii TaxID=52441 RepID=UPI000D4E3E93|nr:PEP-CTERM sorting domain-containing protein [Nitrosomonas aestuarii]PTN13180.1 putative secreted protein [Nitrosomonas aestuarii]
MNNKLVSILGAFLFFGVTTSAQAIPLTGPSPTGGYIIVESSGACAGYCAEGTNFIADQTWTRHLTLGSLSMSAGGSVNHTEVKANINGMNAGGRIIASHADTYTLHGPAGTGLVPVSATLDVTGIRSPLANTAVGFGTFGRSAFVAGSSIFYYEAAHPINVDQVLTYSLDVLVDSTFSFSTIIDLLVRSDQIATFGSTAVLGFILPEGYYVSSVEGFNGVGSRLPDPSSGVPEPASLGLLGLGLAMLGLVRRRKGND